MPRSTRRRPSRKPKKPRKRVARKGKRASKPKKATKKRVTRRLRRKTKKSQTGSLRRVWNGTAKYTKSGLTKKDLCVNKRGKVLSKKRAKAAAKSFKNIQPWLKCCKRAKKELGHTGFVPCKKGTKYYKLAKKYYTQ